METSQKRLVGFSALSAAAAAAYIALVALFLSEGETLFENVSGPFAPMVLLMLLVASVAVMAVLFFGRPAMLFMEGKRKEAALSVVWTVGLFLGATFVTIAALAGYSAYGGF